MKFLNRFEPPIGGGRLWAMEGMRGFAALLVFFVHFEALFGSHINTKSILDSVFRVAGSFGHTGVDLFFVLSGYLIYNLIFTQPGFIRFLRRRINRLYPVFMAVMLMYIGLSFVFPKYSKIPALLPAALWYLAANLLMLPGITSIVPMIAVAWSLSYEWFFYLLTPLTVAVFRMRSWTSRQRILFFFLSAAGQVWLCALGWANHSRLIMFISGMILWELTKHYGIASKLPAWGEYIAIVAFCLNVILIGFAHPPKIGSGAIVLTSVPVHYSTPLFATMFFLTLYGLFYEGLLARIFCWHWLRFVGNISYSFYLIHGLALHGLRGVLSSLSLATPHTPAPFLALFALSLAVAISAAALLYLGVEKPFLEMKKPNQGIPAAKPLNVVSN